MITAAAMLTTTSVAPVGQINGQVSILRSNSEGPTLNELPSNVRSTELITNGTTGQTEGSNSISNDSAVVSRGVAAGATIDNQTGTIIPNQLMQQEHPLSFQPITSLIPNEQTLQVPGALHQSSERTRQ